MATTEPRVSRPELSEDGKRTVAFAALRHPPFRIYLVVSMLAMTGDNMGHVISYWGMFQEFRSPLLGGYAVISHWLLVVLFGLYAGALATAISASAQVWWASC